MQLLTAMLGKPELGEEARTSWGGNRRRMGMTADIADIRRTSEGEMKRKKMGKKQREMEEAFYWEAWGREIEELDNGYGTRIAHS